MRFALFTACLILGGTAGFGTITPADASETATPVGLQDGHFDGLSRDAYLAEMQKTGEAYKAATFLLHSRIDPDANLPPVAWSEAERAQAACMYDGAKADGLLDEHSQLLVGMSRAAAFITNTPGMTMSNAAQFSSQMPQTPPSAALMEILRGCAQ